MHYCMATKDSVSESALVLLAAKAQAVGASSYAALGTADITSPTIKNAIDQNQQHFKINIAGQWRWRLISCLTCSRQ